MSGRLGALIQVNGTCARTLVIRRFLAKNEPRSPSDPKNSALIE